MKKKLLTHSSFHMMGKLVFWVLMLLSFSSHAQIQISGKVVGEDGESLPGTTVIAEGTTVGAVTDIEGNYSLLVPEGVPNIVFSFIGYAVQTVSINGRSIIDVVMQIDAETLGEVVVVGYGTQAKKDVTGAIASLDGAKISERGSVGALQGMQGQIAGVDITAGSGRAGSDYNITIRGANSFQGGNVLYVVDGMIVDDISFLNPQDIGRIDILKDASSSAIYGSRGSNGVVIVTTKQGDAVKGAATISYDGYFGVKENVRKPDFMNGTEWWEFRQNSYITGKLANGDPYDDQIGGLSGSDELARRIEEEDYFDWANSFLQTGIQQNHYLSASGRNDNMNYVIGIGYQEETGSLENEWFNRYNIKGSINHEISDYWKVGLNVNLAVTETERGSADAIKQAYRMPPVLNPYDSLGELVLQPGKYDGIGFTSSVNPLLDINDSEDKTRRVFALASVYIEFKPIEWLTVKTSFSPRFDYRRRGRYFGSQTERNKGGAPSASKELRENFSYIWDNIVTASKSFGSHTIKATGLYSAQLDRREREYIEVAGLAFNSSFHNLGSASSYQEISSNSDDRFNYEKSTLQSYLLRFNYSFNDRFLVTVSNRWDGSSKLAKGHKWESFPSVALGWRVSEESFLRNSSVVSNLKIRASYGYTGNNNVNPYATQSLASTQKYYNYGSISSSGFAPSGIGNDQLTWEKTREFNLGIDFELLKGRVFGNVEIYDRLSDGLLVERQVPYEAGGSTLFYNVGSVQNRGVEAMLTTINFRSSDFEWSTTFTFTKNNNEIIEIFGDGVNELLQTNDDNDKPQLWKVGESVNVNYDYVFGGIWQESERDAAAAYGQTPGQARVLDLDDNGIIDANDRSIIGQIDPTWMGSFSTSVKYKSFDLSASILTRQGIQVWSPFHNEFTNVDDRGRSKLNINYYMPENAITQTRVSNKYPQPKNTGQYWSQVRGYKDASFVKVQNIQLGYTLTRELAERIKMKSLRVYFNVLNPFVWTKYTGFDPEWADEGLNDTGNSTVTYQLGLNLKF